MQYVSRSSAYVESHTSKQRYPLKYLFLKRCLRASDFLRVLEIHKLHSFQMLSIQSHALDGASKCLV